MNKVTIKPKGLRSYTGLDCSGKTKVLPPTFKGIKALVAQVGELNAKAMFPQSDPRESQDEESRDIVRDFLQEYQMADKVERQTLINDFNSYIDDLELNTIQDPSSVEQEPPKEGAPDKSGEAQPEPPAEE